MTTDDDLAELRAVLEHLRAENAQLRDELACKSHRHTSYFAIERDLSRLRAAVARVLQLCDDELLTDESDAKLVRAALRGAP